MSNMTKAIAVLGVVAGLGVAALPLSSYAAPVQWSSEADTNDPAAWGTTDGKNWVKTDVGVKLKIEDALSIEADKDNTDAGMVDLSGTGHTGEVNVTIITNNNSGYNLTLAGTAAKNATSLTSDNGDQILAATAAFAAPAALDATTNSVWGYSVAHENQDNLSDASKTALAKFTGSVYAGVKEGAGEEIVNVKSSTGDAGDKTTVTFAAALKDGQPAGTYKGKVTFTATNNVANVAE